MSLSFESVVFTFGIPSTWNLHKIGHSLKRKEANQVR